MEKMNNLRSDKFKDRCDSITNLSFERDSNTFGFSWPHRNYTCSFCKKQFKSAQALGGHMNIHRRERAKLRQSPSWDCPNLSFNPNPNSKPNLSSSLSPAARFLPYLSYHSSLTSFSSQSSASTDEEKRVFKPQFQIDPASPPCGDLPKKVSIGAFLGVGQLKSFEEESRVLKNKENIVRLELGIGLLRDVKEDLDLELRLGCS